jgi:hypothetical protein
MVQNLNAVIFKMRHTSPDTYWTDVQEVSITITDLRTPFFKDEIPLNITQ